jgi:hypothetical protein
VRRCKEFVRASVGARALGCFLTLAVLLSLQACHDKGYVKGPVSRRIREITTPVTDWILAEYEREGAAPTALPSDLANVMDGMPYSWSYGGHGGFLRVGSSSEFPDPLYAYDWTIHEGWHWWCDPPVDPYDDVDDFLRRRGYTD